MPRARVGDIDIHYLEAGSGPPLVLLHGLGGSVGDWEHQVPVLSRQHRVIAPDLRGFGQTPSGRRFPTVPCLCADVAGLLDQLGVRQFVLIGHSMGGAVALQLALDRPQAVQRLVIANSVPSFRPQSPRHYLEFAYRWLVMGLLGPARLARIGAQRQFPDPAQAEQRARHVARGAHNTRRAYLGALAGLGRWSVIPRLGELQMPVLVAASEHDYFGHEETVRFAHALPCARLHLFRGAHHGLPAEHPARFNEVVHRFLDGPPPRPRHG